jgi:hypothetical protein
MCNKTKTAGPVQGQRLSLQTTRGNNDCPFAIVSVAPTESTVNVGLASQHQGGRL